MNKEGKRGRTREREGRKADVGRERRRSSHEEKQSMGQKHPSLRPALAQGGQPSGPEQRQPSVWPLMPHLEFAPFGWVAGAGRAQCLS